MIAQQLPAKSSRRVAKVLEGPAIRLATVIASNPRQGQLSVTGPSVRVQNFGAYIVDPMFSKGITEVGDFLE